MEGNACRGDARSRGDMSVMWTVTEIAEELEEDEEVVARLLAEDKSVMSTTVYFM